MRRAARTKSGDGTVKKTGCCTMCDKEVFEIVQRYAQDSPIKKEPMKIGKPYPEAVLKVFVLMDGSTMDLTFCDQCDPEPKDFPVIWKKVLKSWARELDPDHRRLLKLSPLQGEKLKQATIWFESMKFNLPMGIISSRKWNELCPQT